MKVLGYVRDWKIHQASYVYKALWCTDASTRIGVT